MLRKVKVLFGAALALTASLLAGYALFLHTIFTWRPVETATAEAIVVLTGDEARITAGLELLHDRRGRRLLISGWLPGADLPVEIRQWLARRPDAGHLDCCIDIGFESLNTVGNAREAEDWASLRGYRRLLVVTSSYHMPRSLIEFYRAMPDVELVPYPVAAEQPYQYLAGEYLKFLAATIRLGGERLFDGGGKAIAVARRAIVSPT